MSGTKTGMLERARELQPDIIETRRYFHQHPELSFQETETAKVNAARLKELGYSVQTGVAKTGVVGDIGTGRIVAIRADMDGLPIEEANNLPFASANQGVMHACGHDAHMACGLAAAKLLSGETNIDGAVRILMQPSEENVDAELKSGAMRMLEEGVMDRVSAVIGLHVDSSLPAGKVAIMPGAVMAAADVFRITIIGKGGHGAYPESTIDAVALSAQVINALQQIVSRRIAAVEPAVLTIGSVSSSSTRGNIISETVTLLGSIRSFNDETRNKLKEEITRACNITRALGGDFKLDYQLGYPATVNNFTVAMLMNEVARELIGEENVITIPPKTWSEDFSVLAQAAPGAFMFLGCEVRGDRRSHHSPTFDIDESHLFLGPAILAETAKRLMTI
ncbi:MAG: amidohydrolase [Candidatus Obscuribacterales bacterium]|nr:amidohydrolase [Candidatus Obscuribacterales bacterium]